MGFCLSKEEKIRMYMQKLPPSYRHAKQGELKPVKAEHTNYDYAEVNYPAEDLAVISLSHTVGFSPDYIALIDLDENSSTYSQIICKVRLGNGEEPGRMNWISSASHLNDIITADRTHLVVPCMNTNRIYIIAREGRQLRIAKVIHSNELHCRDISCPYAVHSLPIKGAPAHVSTMGDRDGHAKGDFLLIDKNTFELRTRKKADVFSGYGGDFSLQTRHNVVISCEWGHPRLFRNGLTVEDLENVSTSFGNCLHVWQISPGVLKQTIELDANFGQLTTCVRFLHNADCNHAFVCSALGGGIYHLYMESVAGRWTADHVLTIPPYKVTNWISNEIPALLTDMVISLDDHWLYVAGWLHGVIWRFDISDPFRISMSSKISLGGILAAFPDIVLQSEAGCEPTNSDVSQTSFRGGPGTLQLSLDGKRLFVCNSFYKPWDAQFYPDLVSTGSQIIRIDVLHNDMVVNERFNVDLSKMPEGAYAAREIHFISGDCTADSFQ